MFVYYNVLVHYLALIFKRRFEVTEIKKWAAEQDDNTQEQQF